MPLDHSTLPVIATAELPVRYVAAKAAIAECERIDECKDWADKMAALASYAKQSDDESLYKAAVRIRSRAIRRCGELLREIEPGKAGRPNEKLGVASPPISRASAAREAGLSRDQKKTALRVANVPQEEFEALVESNSPPTATELAERGTQKRKPIIDLDGIDPTDHIASTHGQGALRRFVDEVSKYEVQSVVRGARKFELSPMRDMAIAAMAWLSELLACLEDEQ